MSNVLYQINEKLIFLNNFSNFLSEISLKFEICSFFSGAIQQEKLLLREIENYISYRMCLANENLILVLDVTFFFTSSRYCFIKNYRFKSLFLNFEKKGEIESNFLYTPIGGLKLNH